jgi:hypothetical protein
LILLFSELSYVQYQVLKGQFFENASEPLLVHRFDIGVLAKLFDDVRNGRFLKKIKLLTRKIVLSHLLITACRRHRIIAVRQMVS